MCDGWVCEVGDGCVGVWGYCFSFTSPSEVLIETSRAQAVVVFPSVVEAFVAHGVARVVLQYGYVGERGEARAGRSGQQVHP